MRLFFIGTCAATLSACATTSFAPPPVAVTYYQEGAHDTADCRAGGPRGSAVTVTRNIAGAYRLVDTFIETYRCAGHSAANGRQAFDIPAFFATTGAAAAVALGGGATYGIVGTAANSVFNAGGRYWDPKLKAGLYDHALDALLCIKTEAVGIPAYKFANASTETVNKLFSLGAGASTVSVSSDQQYFEMVSSAAFSVERILAQRLSNMAGVDASAVAAELGKAIEETRAKEKERAKAASAAGTSSAEGEAEAIDDTGQAVGAPEEDSVTKGLWAQRISDNPKQTMIDLDLAVLKPKLDECVIRAKL